HDEDVDPAHDVEGRQGDHQARDPADRHHDPVGEADGEPDAEAGQKDDHYRYARGVAEQAGREVGREPDHRADGQVHAPADDHHPLAEREQGEDGRVGQDEGGFLLAGEPGLDAHGDRDEHDQDDDDAGLPDTEDPLGQPARADPRRRPGGLIAGGDGRPHPARSSWPVAADMIFSSEASGWEYSAVSRPSRITRIRSPIWSTSGSSEEIIKMATPSPASRTSSSCRSALVAMSMPRGGSSTMSSAGRRPSHLARTTFCWLPPDSMDTGSVSRPYFSRSRWAQSVANARSAADRMKPPCRSLASEASATFCWIDMSMTRPCWRRSSGT